MNKLLNAFEGLLAPLGRSLRYAANELDRYGCSLERNFAPFEELNRHRRLMALGNTKPTLGTNVFVAPNAAVVGDVTIGKDSTVWYGAVLRGDVNHIQIGNKTSIGDNSIIHVAKNSPSGPQPTVIGDNVVVDTGAIIHACKLEDGCRVESGAVIFDGVVVEKNAIVGAGSVVPTGKRIPAGQYWAGNPAKFVRNVSDSEKTELANLVNQHFTLAKKHWDVHQMTEQEKYYDLKQTDKSPPEIIPRTF